MMNFCTRPPSSLSFFSLSALAASVASASRPRMMAFSKFFRKSFLDPKKLGLAKLSKEKYSDRSFCETGINTSQCEIQRERTWIGVPDKITRRLTFKPLRAWNVSDSEFFNRCPSSQRSSPIEQFWRWAVKVRRVSYETIITGSKDQL